MGTVINNPASFSSLAPQERSFLLGIAIAYVTSLAEPGLDQFWNGVIKKVGKTNAGAVLVPIHKSLTKSLKKNKIPIT